MQKLCISTNNFSKPRTNDIGSLTYLQYCKKFSFLTTADYKLYSIDSLLINALAD